MAGFAGIESDGQQRLVTQMLEKISHRGQDGSKVIESHGSTLGAVWSEAQTVRTSPTMDKQAAWDGERPPLPDPALLEREWEPFALAASTREGLFLARDPLGVKPLYYGHTAEGAFIFASEVKALLDTAEEIHEFPPGAWYSDKDGFQIYRDMTPQPVLEQEDNEIVDGLRLRLEQAVVRRIDNEVMGCWLSGGLDSSAMAALALPHVQTLHTFAAGMEGAPDLEFAQQVAEYLGTEHHEVKVTQEDLLAALPLVIYHLESFDALLVRSSITNYLAARFAANCVGSVFSGEGADELFAGYAYLKNINADSLPSELMDITGRLHNTALQRVDRSASAHGLEAHVPFLDPDVVAYALGIPAELKLHSGKQAVEKWVVRQALEGTLPDEVLWRRKAKFWQGAGIGEQLAAYANEQISDREFSQERDLPNGWRLNTKEELMYYRIFREHFGDLADLTWMGRTKGAPQE